MEQRKRATKSESHAFTLVEMLVASVILVIVIGMVGLLYARGNTVYRIIINETDVQKICQEILDTVVYGNGHGSESLAATSMDLKNLSTASAIYFVDRDNRQVGYYLDNKTVYKQPYDETGNPLFPPIDLDLNHRVDISDLRFTYYADTSASTNPDGIEDPALGAEDTRRIGIELTGTNSRPTLRRAIRLFTSVRPNNLN
jgi:prepilin-type N-terminal cleavage/methylation domain-containing protein